ncbi:MAG: hypothetical protein WCP95_06505 [Actinomycetes bacterium]
MAVSRADRVMRVGAAITALGLLFTLIAILPLFFPSLALPSALWFLSMLTGVGIVVICAGLVMSARSRRAPAKL